MKLIALDVGTKRIGVAKADSKVRIAIPYAAVEVDNGAEFQKIASLARAWDIENFVIGLPRNNSGEETKQSAYVRNFAKKLKTVIPGAKICFQDESLTSVEAEKRLGARKKGYKKGDIDSEAAAIILQDFLEEKTGKATSRAAAAGRRSVKAKKPRRLVPALAALCCLLVLSAAAGYIYYDYSLKPVAEVDCSSASADECSPISFAVTTGSTVGDIAAELKSEGLIRDALVFQLYYRLNSCGESLKAGSYQISSTLAVSEIVDLFLSGSRDNVFSFTIFPGETSFKIRDKLVDLGYEADDVDAALDADYSDKDFAWIFEGRPADSHSLEGYLWADTYEFYTEDTAEAIISRLLEESAKKLKSGDYAKKFEAQGFSLYEGLTLASVVQREANNAEDMAKVSQVFKNRLDHPDAATAGFLGSDVTASYAADTVDYDREVYTDNAAILDIDSPYNTRRHPGLPYGPVSTPGIAALDAVATPDGSMSEAYYFLTGDDGVMYYGNTEADHQWNIQNYCQELCGVSL